MKSGLEIYIPGVLASPEDKEPCPIFIEQFRGDVEVHIWDGSEDCRTTILTNTEETPNVQ